MSGPTTPAGLVLIRYRFCSVYVIITLFTKPIKPIHVESPICSYCNDTVFLTLNMAIKLKVYSGDQCFMGPKHP